MNLIKFEYNKHCYGEIQKMWVKHKTKKQKQNRQNISGINKIGNTTNTI